MTPLQIEAEWVEYKTIFEDLLKRHGAMLARSAKSEKARLDRIQEDLGHRPAAGASTKAELRARAAELRGLGRFRTQLELSLPPDTEN